MSALHILHAPPNAITIRWYGDRPGQGKQLEHGTELQLLVYGVLLLLTVCSTLPHKTISPSDSPPITFLDSSCPVIPQRAAQKMPSREDDCLRQPVCFL